MQKHTERQTFLFLLHHHCVMLNSRSLALVFVSYLLLQNQQREHKTSFVYFHLISVMV